jgi:uncharacterized membrane protein
VLAAAPRIPSAWPSTTGVDIRRECVIIRHPRRDGQYAFAFITGQTTLRQADGDLELFCVYVPTNHGERAASTALFLCWH